MITKSIFPKQIAKMISTGYSKGWSSIRIANHINSSKTAEKLGVSYSYRTIAAKVANITRQ